MILRFDQFVLDTDRYELTRAGEAIAVEPKVFDLIAHLAGQPQRVFRRDELIDAVWEGRVVSDATVATGIKTARKVLGDSGDHQRFIRTVRGRGFCFCAEVTRHESEQEPHGSPGPQAVEPLPTRAAGDPVLAVLPLECLSDDPELQRVASGLALDLATVLTRVPLLRLTTRADRPASPEPEATRADFTVDGAVQDLGGRLSVNLRLSDAGGLRIWAETFELTEPLAESLQGCVAAMVGKLEPQLQRAMYRAVRSRDGQPSARELFLEATGVLVMQGWHHESFGEATDLLERAAELEPDLAVAPALLSLLLGFGARLGLAPDRGAAEADTVRWAEQALRADGMDSTVLGYAGCSLADVGHLDRGESLLRNAVELNPANGQAWVALGALLLQRRQVDRAIEYLAKGIEISPRDSRLSVWGALFATALLMAGDPAAACEAALDACRRNDRTYLPRVVLAGARLAAGDRAAALAALADARRAKPDLTPLQITALIGSELSRGLVGLEAGSPR